MKTSLGHFARRPLSLTFRLTLFISIMAIAAFSVFSWVTIRSVEQHFEEQDINQLQELSATLSRFLGDNNLPEATRIEKVTNAVSQQVNAYLYLENQRHQRLFQSPGGPDFQQIIKQNPTNAVHALTWSEERAQPQSHSGDDSGHEPQSAGYRVMSLPIPTVINGQATHYRMVIALSINFHLHYIQELTRSLSVAALLICLIIVLIVRIAVYQGHAPLRRVSKTIKSITSDNLDVRLQPNEVPIELQQLVVSFNSMIERIEDVFKRQSNFSADIAHEIRTPITNLATQTQIALSQNRSAEDYQEVLYSNLEEYERMAKMVSDMLFLAQADNHLLIPESEIIDLNVEIGKVFEYFEAWAEEKGVTLCLVGNAAPIKGDVLMLRRVINNLLSNAVRYTPQGKCVIVTLSQIVGGVNMSFANPGLDISAEHLPRLFDRFYRVDQSRQRKGEGSGIGLAIVKSIIEAHRGKVTVTSNSGVTEFTVSMPQ
ncbi:Cu(+)/Ag(+) sensor histidine kinase [Budvicia diplopodorum]|uniref:Cu(+)/Ag(+) sensor histidine kinase n=1 Tax=Budvicia diplopodorum TaxID=1119056 RepID=UPI001359FB8F|nr:Cu(+)/Ag(+) sensor histidine kinase [Budvicia diplopodorum]